MRGFAAALLLLWATSAHAQQAAVSTAAPSFSIPVNAWPLLYESRSADTYELELLFSLFEYSRDHRKTDLAVRPFYWRDRDPDRDAAGLSILWPLSDYRRLKDDRRLWVLPLFWLHANDQMSRSLLFPLYSAKRDGRVTRLGVIGYTPVTLFDFQHDPVKDRDFQRYLLWTHTREGRHSEWSFLPLYEQTTAPGLESYSLIPVYAYYRNTRDDSVRVSALGLPDTYNLFEYHRRDRSYEEWHDLLVYHLNSDAADRLVVFPLYWDLRGRDRRFFQLWPFYGFEAKGTSLERSTIWPFFRWRRDDVKGERELNLFWPLVKSMAGPGAYRHERLWPLYAVTSDPDSEKRPSLLALDLASPLPTLYSAAGQDYSYRRFLWLGWWANNAEFDLSVFVPYYSVRNKQAHWKHQGLFPLWNTSRWDDSSFTFILPTFVSYSNPALLARTFFPLFYEYRSTETAWTAAVPLFFQYRSTTTALDVLFPLYYHDKDAAQDSEFRYFFPVYGTYRRGAHVSSHLLFFPLYATYRDDSTGYRSFDALWPLIHHDTAPGAYSTRALPLYWSSEAPASGFRVAFPLYWEFRAPQSSQRHFLPFYGSYRSADGFSLTYALGPLFTRIQDTERDFDFEEWLGFLAGRMREGDKTESYVFPLLWTERSPRSSRLYLLPLLGHEDDGPESESFFLGVSSQWSLFHHFSDPTTGFSETQALVLFSQNDPGGYTDVIFPLFWAWGDRHTDTSILFPLYEWQSDGNRRRAELSLVGLSGGLSLFHFLRDDERRRYLSRVLIFERYQRGEDVQTVGFPLFWRFYDPEDTRTYFFPFFTARVGGEDNENRVGVLGVTPEISLYSWSDEADEATSRLWPLFGWRRETAERASELGLIGVYYPYTMIHWRSTPDAFEHHVFPLYFYHRSGAAADPERSVRFSALWQVTTYQREGSQKSDFRLLWRLVRVERDHGDSDVEVNPFYFRIQKQGRGSYWAVLGGLLGKQTNPDGTSRWRCLWFL